MKDGIRPRSCWLEIDLESLHRNMDVIEQACPDDVSILSVVKADAYGHGAEVISQELADRGIDFLGVATLEEAIKLRNHGINTNILIMGHMATFNVEELFEYNLTPMIYSYRLLHAIEEEASKQNTRQNIHLKFDTGMGRLGLRQNDAEEYLREVKSLDHVTLDGVATHFAQAGENPEYTQEQVDAFQTIKQEITDMGFNPTYWHAMNSAALFSSKTSAGNMVRPGITLYGYPPDPSLDIDGLEPVMQVKCKMADYKRIGSGHGVSYGRIYTPDEPTWVGVLPIGYADGYTRLFSNKSHVLKDGQCRDVLGNVCMDMTIIQCHEQDDPEGIVTLMGRDNGKELWADTLADWQGTISYEILSSFSPRLPRLYFRDDKIVAQKSEQGVEWFDTPHDKESMVR